MRQKLLLLLLGVLSSLPALARDFKYTYEGQTINYTVIDEDAKTCMTKEAYFEGNVIAGNSVSGDIILPENPKDGDVEYTLIGIGELSFLECDRLTSVVIPNSVTSIGEDAFFGCSSLISVVIPNSVTSIGKDAFFDCTSLIKAEFSSIESLCNISFGDVYANPLYYAHHLYIDGVEVTEVVIPETVTSIGKAAFYGCSGLTSVLIPNSVETIGDGAFAGCSALPSVEIPNSVSSIGESAFYGCSSLTSVVIPNSAQTIDSYAFRDCSNLTTVLIGNSVQSIGENAFEGCSGLIKAEFSSIESLCNISFDNGFANPLSYTGHLYIDGNEVTELIIPESVITIVSCTFVNCSSVTSVEIPNSVTEIGPSAFEGCSGLTSVVIPNSVQTIGGSAFEGCSGLTTILIGNSVETIGQDAFKDCSGLKKSAYPNSLENPFEKGTTISYNPEGAILEDGWIWGPEKTSVYFAPLSLEGEYSIPESVTSIGEFAFSGCSALESVVIGNSVQTIDKYAFSGCSALKKSAYPNTLNNPFDYGTAIAYNPEGAILEDGWVWGPKKTALYFAPLSLEGEYTIPESVTSIGKEAFYGCSGLTSVLIGNSVETIGEDAFKDCRALIKSAYPNYLKNPFEYGTAISYNPEGAIIEDGWVWGPEKTEIRFAPWNLEGEYILPESVTSIGQEAFYGCSGVTSVTALSVSPADVDNDSFKGLYDTVKLTVPDNAAVQYLATPWSLFKNIHNNSGAELGHFSDGVFEYRLNPADMTASVIGAKEYSNLQIPERFTDDSDAANPVRYIIKGIGYNAFGGKEVNSVEFNSRSQMEYIGDYAFAGTNIIEIILPESTRTIGKHAFENTQNLIEVQLNDGLSFIDGHAFKNSGLISINLPETVSYIGSAAFRDADRLTSIAIPENVTEIKDYTFYNCTALTDVKLNNILVSIGDFAFSMDYDKYDQNRRYGSLDIPATLKSVGEEAFLYRFLNKVIISDLRAWCDIDFNSWNSNPLGWAVDGLWIGGTEIVDLVIPEGVEVIKPVSFTTCNRLRSVVMPSSVTSIGWGAFFQNYDLTSVSFSRNLKSIDGCAFQYCRIPSVSIPASVDYIGPWAFIAWSYEDGQYFTKYLTSFTLEDGPNPIMIEEDAFEIPTEITGDNQIRYNTPETFYMGRPIERIPDGFKKTLKDLTVGNTIEDIADGMFANYSYINKLALGSSIRTIGDEAFSGCTSLYEVILPPSVETIGASAFAGDSRLASIIMGHKVKSIGEKAFDGCKANTVSITAQTPPTAPNNTFSNYSGKLYLQGEKTKDAYYDAFTCWDRFDSYVMIDAEEIKILGADKISGKAGDTFQLTASIWPENVTLPQIFWRATNPEIATVDENGLVTLHVDLESLKTRAQGEGDIDGACTIIAETLYNDGPVAQIAVDESGLNVVEGIAVSGEGNGSIDYSQPYEVYSMEGLKVSDSTEGLAKGIYIIRQGKAAVKTAVR